MAGSAVVIWPEFLQTARVRAVEETDAAPAVWDEVTLCEAGSALSKELGVTDEAFIAARASQLAAKVKEPKLWASFFVPSIPSFVAVIGWIAAAAAGEALGELGQSHEINILSLPLVTIVAWNLIVCLVSLFHGLGDGSAAEPPRWLLALHDRFSPIESKKNRPAFSPRHARFRELAWPVALRRLAFRFRAWLHIAAAFFALAAVGGMYSRGWSRDYRAVWESTLLDEGSARSFFGAFFAPASAVSGIAIPLDGLPAMRRTANAPAPHPGDALPWINLYAATLGLFVIAPRIVLAFLERRRAERVTVQTLCGNDWREYASRVRQSGDGSGAPVSVLVHGVTISDASRDRWRGQLRRRWRDAGPLQCMGVPVGGEGGFAEAWQPDGPRVAVVFNLSGTPEHEVHRAFVEAIGARLAQTRPGSAVLLALDDVDLRKRWSGFADAETRLSARRQSWREMMNGLPVEWAP